MSVQTIQNRISTIQREIDFFRGRLATKSMARLSKLKRISQIRGSITKLTSTSSQKSKYSEIERLEGEVLHLQQDEVDLSKRISDKEKQLNELQQQFFKEQDKEQQRLNRALEDQMKESKKSQQQLLERLHMELTDSTSGSFNRPATRPDVIYDAFICHASEDKNDLVRPLAESLQAMGHAIWYDEFELKVGDSLRRSIDRGLARSRFGIVVLSPSFFAKNWPQYELDGLVAKETAGNKVILPLWHKVSKDEVIIYSPTLADRVALNTTTYTIVELAQELGKALKETSSAL